MIVNTVKILKKLKTDEVVSRNALVRDLELTQQEVKVALQPLMTAGIAKVRRGYAGGVYLATKPTLAEVFVACGIVFPEDIQTQFTQGTTFQIV